MAIAFSHLVVQQRGEGLGMKASLMTLDDILTELILLKNNFWYQTIIVFTIAVVQVQVQVQETWPPLH